MGSGARVLVVVWGVLLALVGVVALVGSWSSLPLAVLVGGGLAAVVAWALMRWVPGLAVRGAASDLIPEPPRARVDDDASGIALEPGLRGRFDALSHDLRTQLTTVIGLTEALLELEPDPAGALQTRYLNGVLTAARDQLRMINAILGVEIGVEPPLSDPGAVATGDRPLGTVVNATPAGVAEGGITILAIDNQPMVAEVIEALLGPSGYHVLAAATGEAGLALATSDRPNLITLDLGLPDLDGFAVLARLRADPVTAAIPVVVLTGQSLSEADRAQLAGQVAYIAQKGEFNRAGFLRLVQDALRPAAEP